MTLSPLERIRRDDPPHLATIEAYARSMNLRGLSPISVAECCYKLHRLLLFTQKDADQITARDIEDYFLAMRQRGLSPTTIRNNFIVLRSYFEGRFPERVETLFPFTVGRPKRRLPDYMTQADVEALLSCCTSQRDRALVMFLWDSGCRCGELVQMNLGDVSFEQYCGAAMIGRDARRDRQDRTHTKTGMRRVPLTLSVPDLQLYLQMHPFKGDPTAPLWCSLIREGGEHYRLEAHGLSDALRLLGVRAGISRMSVSPHKFRHGRATDLARRGFTEMELRIFLGWEPSSTMPATYVHLSGGDVEKKVKRLAGLVPDEAPDSTFEPRVCPRCRRQNPYDADLCWGCSLILNPKVAIQLDEYKQIVLENPDSVIAQMESRIAKLEERAREKR